MQNDYDLNDLFPLSGKNDNTLPAPIQTSTSPVQPIITQPILAPASSTEEVSQDIEKTHG
jgi:hypothetical protein